MERWGLEESYNLTWDFTRYFSSQTSTISTSDSTLKRKKNLQLVNWIAAPKKSSCNSSLRKRITIPQINSLNSSLRWRNLQKWTQQFNKKMLIKIQIRRMRITMTKVKEFKLEIIKIIIRRELIGEAKITSRIKFKI